MVSLSIALLISLLAQTSIALAPLNAPLNRGAEKDITLAQKFMSANKPFARTSHPFGMIMVVSLPLLWSFGVISPQQASAADIARGATLFTANCAGCHAGGQNVVNQKKTLQKEDLQKYLGSTDAVQI